jgi:hypothetical protein
MLMSVSLASAQMAGEVGLYADPLGGSCFITDAAPGLLPIYAVHVWSPGASAIQFSAVMPACMVGASFLSDTSVYPVTIGNSQNGVAIGYGACIASPNNVLIINYFVSGLTTACCELPVGPDPNVPSGSIEVVDCDSQLITGVEGLSGMVNGNPTDCECDPAVGTEESTWGKVKALYSE